MVPGGTVPLGRCRGVPHALERSHVTAQPFRELDWLTRG